MKSSKIMYSHKLKNKNAVLVDTVYNLYNSVLKPLLLPHFLNKLFFNYLSVKISKFYNFLKRNAFFVQNTEVV